jgi:hypothetical protein
MMKNVMLDIQHHPCVKIAAKGVEIKRVYHSDN